MRPVSVNVKPWNASMCVAAMQRKTGIPVRQKTKFILRLLGLTHDVHCPFNGNMSKHHYLKKGMGKKKINLP